MAARSPPRARAWDKGSYSGSACPSLRGKTAAPLRLGLTANSDFVAPGSVSAPALRGIRVLVVDDDDDSRDLVVSILDRCGAITSAASSAEHALSLIERDVPDVLISDIGMPGMDGYELMRAFRALPDARAQNVPAVAVTAYARSEDKQRALAEGFQLHVAKPIEPAAFATAAAGYRAASLFR